MASQPLEQRDVTSEDADNLYTVVGDKKLVDYLTLNPGFIYGAIVDEEWAVFWTVVPGVMVRRQFHVRLYEGDAPDRTTELMNQEAATWGAYMVSLHAIRPVQ